MPLGVLEPFDNPVMFPNCGQRACSTVAPQSLLMMNNEFVAANAVAFAARIKSVPNRRFAIATPPGLALCLRRQPNQKKKSRADWLSRKWSADGKTDGSVLPRSFVPILSYMWSKSMSLHARRHFLMQGSFGISGLAFAWLMHRDRLSAAPPKPSFETPTYTLEPKPTIATPTATAMISMFMQGGPSHIDLFDPKPELSNRHMQTFSGEIKFDNAAEASTKLLEALGSSPSTANVVWISVSWCLT